MKEFQKIIVKVIRNIEVHVKSSSSFNEGIIR